MRTLPTQKYHFTEFKLARVNIDYHLEYDKHYYSVPHHLVKHQVEVRATRGSVVVFFKGKAVAHHIRSLRQGSHTTEATHMPTAHRRHQEWSKERLLNWAKDIGPNVLRLTDVMFERKAHPEQAYRSCLGVLNLSRTYDAKRLDNACKHALFIGSPTVRSIKSILQKGIDQLETPLPESSPNSDENVRNGHDNIRGSDYFN